MKHAIEIPIAIVKDGAPIEGGFIVVHVEATTSKAAKERLASAIEALVKKHEKESQ